jgi:hypothetical protein
MTKPAVEVLADGCLHRRDPGGFAHSQPAGSSGALTFRAMPVAAVAVAMSKCPQSSQGSPWPPRATVRQFSIAGMTSLSCKSAPSSDPCDVCGVNGLARRSAPGPHAE